MKNLSLNAKIAFGFFILGKISFLPSVSFLFLGKKDLSLISIFFYISFILMSIVFCLIDIKRKKQEIDFVKDRIVNSKKEETIVLKVKNGKIVETNFI